MAKAVANKGFINILTLSQLEGPENLKKALRGLYSFVDEYRSNDERLSSCALILDTDRYSRFDVFEKAFWKFLSALHKKDKETYPHDPRVAADPTDDNFSFSVKSEAFFILALHPESPRWARRFKYPAIIFNPHRQFERLREKGIFTKVRDIIRLKDKLFQGSINPMLNDFGSRSEVFQYTGRAHAMNEPVPNYL